MFLDSSIGPVSLERLHNSLHAPSCSSKTPVLVIETKIVQGSTSLLLDSSIGPVSLERLHNSLNGPGRSSNTIVLVIEAEIT